MVPQVPLAPSGRAIWLRSQCLGLCERAPAALVSSAGEQSRERVLAPASAEAVQSLINDAVQGRLPAEPDVLNVQTSVPQSGTEKRTARLCAFFIALRRGGATTLEAYQRLGGYEGLRKALELGPEGTLRELSASKLLGRGGAAFPTAKKWEALFLQRDRAADKTLLARTTSSAMPMNPSLAPSKTAFSWKAIPSPCSKA